MKKKRGNGIGRRILTGISVTSTVISIIFFLFLIFIFLGIFISPSTVGSGNVAVIPINGVITTDGASSFNYEGIGSTQVVRWIEEANANPAIEAIIFEINSPGGTPVGSNEIVQAVKDTNKPTMAVIREVGASGAYWVASSTDTIVANELSVTGSIGVISSYLDFSGLIQDYNVSYERLVAGKYKDAGTPLRELTREEKLMMQAQLDKIHNIFMQDVSENRGIPLNQLRQSAQGQIFLGIDAKENGLVDELGTMKDAVKILENQLGIEADLLEFKKPVGFLGNFGNVMDTFSFNMGEGFANRMLKEDESLFLT